MTTIEKTQQYVLQTYGRFSLTVARGEGTKVWDQDGRESVSYTHLTLPTIYSV